MKTLAAFLALAIVLALPASANIVSRPYTYTNGSPADATQVNANENTLYTLVNGNIDNTNIGSAGIFASQIKCSSITTCIFGGNYGYTFSAPFISTVPLSINGIASQTADLFDIFLTSGGTKEVWIDAAGVLHTAQSPIINGTTFNPASYVQLSPSSAQTGAINVTGAVQGGNLVALGGGASLAISGLSTFSNPGVQVGDGAFQENASVGAMWFGGASSSCRLDYGLTTAAVLTIPCATTHTAKLIESASILNNGTTTTGALDVSNGDLHVSRNGTASNATGYIFMGGFGNYFSTDGLGGFAWAGNGAGTSLMTLSNGGVVSAASLTLSSTSGITFSNAAGPSGYALTATSILSGTTLHIGRSDLSVAGITGALMDWYTGSGGTRFAVDGTGDVGIGGSYYSASRRALKDNIVPYKAADSDIDRTAIVRFCYKTEKCKPGETRHIGFIADDTPTDFSGPKHDGMDVNAVAAANLAAVQELRREVRELKREVAALRAR